MSGCVNRLRVLRPGFIKRCFSFLPRCCREALPSENVASLGSIRSVTLLAAFVILGASVPLAGAATLPDENSDGTLVEKRPDIIYVISDDQAWNDYSFMGHEHIETPNIDKLARESRLFTRGYVPDSLCRPSLATMITGLYPHQHGIVGNDPPPVIKPGQKFGSRGGSYRQPEYQQQIERFLQLHIDQVETLPERLKPLGYASYQTGKWWEGNHARGGFDDGMTHGDHNRGGRHGDVGLKIGREGLQPIADFMQKTKANGKPYFLWYAPFLPHTPHTPPKKLFEKYLKVAPSEPVAKYWAMCEWFDQTVGDLRELVAEHGDPENTIIVYVCDNGWINQLDASRYAPKSKRSQYDGGIRTPIMIHWPSRLTPKNDEVHLASSIDLVPTVMSLVGLPEDSSLPGIDLSSDEAVFGRNAIFGEILEHDIVSLDNPETSLMYRWVIEGNIKLIEPWASHLPDAPVELYDLAEDPMEEKNLASKKPEVVAALKARLDGVWPE